MSTTRISPNYKGFVGTLGGVPTSGTAWLPLTIPYMNGGYQNGRYYFVNENGGDDGQDGLSPAKAKATIASAVTAMNANVYWSSTSWGCKDVLVIYPGLYPENLTALPYGGHVVGLGIGQDKSGDHGVVICPAAGSPVDVSSCLNTTFSNMTFLSPDTSAVFQADTINYCVFDNVTFQGHTDGLSVKGLEVITKMEKSIIRNCYFRDCQAGIYVKSGATGFMMNDIGHSYIGGAGSGSTAVQGIFIVDNLPCTGTIVHDMYIGDGAVTLDFGIESEGCKLNVSNCYITASANLPASGAGYYNGVYLNGTLQT